MAEVSKHMFEQACSGLECHYMMHPWNESCLKAIPHTAKASLIGSAKFYSVIYLAQIAMRGTKMLRSKEEWFRMGEYYARSTALGFLVCGSAPVLGCVLRRLTGDKFGYYTYLLVPNMINGLSIYLEPPHRRGLVINLFCNLMIEYWLRTLEKAGYLVMNKSKQTFLFMIGSAALFYLMRLEGDKEHRTPLFWLFTPEKVKRKTEDSKGACPHKGPCNKHILKGFTKLFGAGAAITLARLVLPRLRNPARAFASIRPHHFKMAMFFGSYIGIYRAIICYLCRRRGYDSALYALPAGYVAGLAFYFNPSVGFSIAAVTAAAKLYSTILYEKRLLPASVPLPELLYCACQGTLFHARFMHPDVCPKYTFNLMKSVSNGCTELLYANMLEALKRAAF
ncbi:hypothetical protein JYU34_004671 [Plutella xylostella]|uniref:Transmembrane protein 135 N-terminal domain-containing protein n=1 Tax=Plutella xylostella TaxID=51655 RepID=A0ABQ7QYK4_PLUXY|nr:hypothetical protein JYU34_004671 [Plutella xylostella]